MKHILFILMLLFFYSCNNEELYAIQQQNIHSLMAHNASEVQYFKGVASNYNFPPRLYERLEELERITKAACSGRWSEDLFSDYVKRIEDFRYFKVGEHLISYHEIQYDDTLLSWMKSAETTFSRSVQSEVQLGMLNLLNRLLASCKRFHLNSMIQIDEYIPLAFPIPDTTRDDSVDVVLVLTAKSFDGMKFAMNGDTVSSSIVDTVRLEKEPGKAFEYSITVRRRDDGQDTYVGKLVLE